ncbi:MAG TPA: Asp-tRNA(Asn)/Glu-tRNA(Gln) amidotransferase subunit GatC [Alphaproteobacteria bacterium]|nr:Asp-tRNA(Asn)/Glu-tRNA(Gln) amidotransferase subunit GatC [Alphaproteobacteria bacterium]
MILSAEETKRIAQLARLKIKDEDLEKVSKDLSGIFNWIDQLTQVDTKDVPIYSLYLNQTATERHDVVCEGGKSLEILKNAPESTHSMFVVPKVVE